MKKVYIFSILLVASIGRIAAQTPFTITSLTNQSPVIVDHFSTSGDDRGGIALNQANVYYTGDSKTAVFNANLTTQIATIYQRDAMVCNISGNGGIYQLMNGASPISLAPPSSGTTITSIQKLDPTTLAPLGSPINLSSALNVNSYITILNGPGYFLIQDENMVYKVNFNNGAVTILNNSFNDANMSPFNNTRSACENGISWGVAEYDGSNYSMAYIKNATTIISRYVHNAAVRDSFSFVNLGDMCSFIISPWNNRWYFHYEGNAQFGGVTETMGYATAVYFGSLPLSINFTELHAAQKSMTTAELFWSCNKPEEVAFYTIEKTLDQTTFEKIGEITDLQSTNFSFIDNGATENKNYYRLKANMKNGEVSYSEVVSTTNNFKTLKSIDLNPNPTSENINILLDKNEIGAQLDIFNQMGQRVYADVVKKTYTTVNVATLPTGVYHVRISSNDLIASAEFLKQ